MRGIKLQAYLVAKYDVFIYNFQIMPDCETFNLLKRSGSTNRIGCPQAQTCDGSTCSLPEAQEGVATLSPEINTSEDNTQGRALTEALTKFIKGTQG